MENLAKTQAIKNIVSNMNRFEISLFEIEKALEEKREERRFQPTMHTWSPGEDRCHICNTYRCTEHF